MSKFKPTITDVHYENKELKFIISGSETYGFDKSIINSIRRTLLTDIPTVAFRTDDNSSKDITITTNTGSLHNEMLLQRIGLIPIYLKADNYKKNYLFELKVTHDDTKPFKFITAEDFTIYPLLPEIRKKMDDEQNISELNEILNSNNYENYDFKNSLSSKEKEKIFRPFEFKRDNSKNYCLITELKNTNASDLKQEINLYGVPSVSTAKENAKFQAVSCATYSFVKNEELIDSICQERMKIEKISKESEEDFITKFILAESERYYFRDNENEPYKYNFSLKSCHYNKESDLFLKAIMILIAKLDHLKLSFLHLLEEKETCISVKKKNDILYHLMVHDETHTMGNLIQSHISRRCIDEKSLLLLIGYKKTHPLEEIIQFILSINPNHPVMKKDEKTKYQTVIEFMISELEVLRQEFKTLLKVSEEALV